MDGLLIDVTRLLGRLMDGRLPTGVDRVSLEYVRHFCDGGQALVRYGGRWLTLSSKDSRRVFDVLLATAADFRATVRLTVAKAYLGPGVTDISGRILINMDHSGLERPDYAARVRRHGLRPIFFLHDLIPITYPEYSRPGEANKHWQRLMTMAACARAIVVNSSATQTAYAEWMRAEGLRLPPCVVAPLAPANLPSPSGMQPLVGPYFVVLGTIEPRKNHLLLLHLWRELVAEFGNAAPKLVVIGQRGWECEQVIDMLERCEALRGFVEERSGCTDAELATWLHHAQALLFPSFAEGYGIPLVEALSLGVPVIASNLPVFRELAADIPLYLDPLDGPGWKRAVMAFASPGSVERESQRARMAGWQAPTWSQHFDRVEELMRRCLPVE